MEERINKIEKILRLLQQKVKDNEAKIEQQESILTGVEEKTDALSQSYKILEGGVNNLTKNKDFNDRIDKIELIVRKISEKVKGAINDGDITGNDVLLKKIEGQKHILLTLQDNYTIHESTINQLISTIDKINTTVVPVLRQTIVALNKKIADNKGSILELQSKVNGISSCSSVGELSVDIGEVKQIKNDNAELRETIKLMKQQIEANNELMKGSINKINQVTSEARGRPNSEMLEKKVIDEFNQQIEKELQKKDKEIISLKTAQNSLKTEIENLKGLRNDIEEIKRTSRSSSPLCGLEDSTKKVRGNSISIATTRSTSIQSLNASSKEPCYISSLPLSKSGEDFIEVTQRDIEDYISQLNVCENIGGYYRTMSNWCNFVTPRVLYFNNSFERFDLKEFNQSIVGLANVMIIIGNKKNEIFGTFSGKMIPQPPGSPAKKDKDCIFLEDDPSHFIFSLSNSKGERRKFLLQGSNRDTVGVYNEKSKDHIFNCAYFFVLKRKEGKFFDSFDKAYGCCGFPICESKSFKPSYIVAIQWSK
ncbi:hypothetical protein EDI_259650 [Entamoeba dispar SAW760]|uniref:TLDc domain-containing protein n=1 Tax=Entamoeba dispar (strain ATCC PRA-260 / SAW760) TaxID=370354 RepID=B0EB81_ENTDS|nr:uncharacterized protein EDI_259650 [Entamoeba dispar SAW760]EDR28229.1 hypothetical protein EDI_259650 [Entamoeba dispar SAW760]|eukprot:EDR28229.1 hypothetical protein EDI_259650 [Entamoeba dispar SAW760]